MTITLDYAKPLADALASYGPMTEGVGDPIDLFAERYTSGANNVTWKEDQNGLRYLDFVGATPHFDLTNPSIADLTLPVTLAAMLSPKSSLHENGLVVQTHDWADDGSVYRGAALRADYVGSNQDIVASFGDGGGATSADERTFRWAGVIESEVPKMYSVTIRGTTDATLWVNGVRQAAPTTGGTGGAMDSAGTIFGHIGTAADTALEYIGGLYTWAIWNRELSDEEHANFAAQPWESLLLNLQLNEDPAIFGLLAGVLSGSDFALLPFTNKPRNRTPWLDWAMPMTHQLLSYGAMGEGASDIRDLASGIYTSDPVGVTWKDDQDGRLYLDFAGALAHIDLDNRLLDDLTLPITMAAVLSPTNNLKNSTVLQTHDWADVGAVYRGGVLRLDTTTDNNHIIASIGDGGGATSADERTFTWNFLIVPDRPGMYAVTIFDNTNADLYLNGVKQAAPTTGGTGTGLVIGGTEFGHLGSNNTTAQEYDGGIYIWSIWNRELSPVEHIAFAADPWDMLLQAELFADFHDPLDFLLMTQAPPFTSEGGRHIVIINM